MQLYSSEFSEEHAKAILEALPTGRRNTYFRIAYKNSTDESDAYFLAARLYVWNGYLASVVDRTTGEIEVLLRNFMNDAFAEWNSASPRNGSRDWLVHPQNELAEIVNPNKKPRLIDSAHIGTVTGTPEHDDYVAGLTFGNWVHLLPKPHAKENNPRVILWNEAIHPRLSCLNRKTFQRRAMTVKDMRNRATHRRPLIKDFEALLQTHQSCVELADAMNPELSRWIRAERWIPEALRKSPLK